MHISNGRSAVDAPSTWGKALALVGLAGVAVTQPLLDLMGRTPEFFVAGRYTGSQIVEFGLVIAFVPSAVLVSAFALARLAHPRVGNVVHGVLIAGLGALFGNVLRRGLGLDSLRLSVVAGLLGGLLTLSLVRTRAGLLLLRYLAAANVFFLLVFLFVSPASALLSGAVDSDALGSVSVPVPRGPVVVIIFDELPLSTLVTSEGTVNAERYPAFARLAAGSTWYRNASSLDARTERAVPAVMTGTVLDQREMPTYQALPRNLLSLLSTAVPVERYEAVTDLCPPDACERRPGHSLTQALSDASIVYGHRVLPGALREGLAPIDDAWGSFGAGIDAGTPDPAPDDEPDDPFASRNPLARYRAFEDSERAPETQALRLVERGLAIDATPALHFVHVVYPHASWWSTPWGTRLMAPQPRWVVEEGEPGYEWSALLRYQRHSLQVGAADVALGQVFDHLEASGLWDDATIVATADHGTSTIPPDLGRDPTDANEDEVFRVPMFIKAAGQKTPVVSDEVALTIDVLPTLMDLLDIESDWEMDGHSLIDGSERHTAPLVTSDLDGLRAVARRHEADFPHGWDWTALAAVGDHGELVGTPLADLEVGAQSALAWAPANENTFGSLPNAKGETPQMMTGTIAGSGGAEPPPVVIVANGTVAGVTGGYLPVDDGWSFSSILGPFLVHGANQIDAYEVTTTDGHPVLHHVG